MASFCWIWPAYVTWLWLSFPGIILLPDSQLSAYFCGHWQLLRCYFQCVPNSYFHSNRSPWKGYSSAPSFHMIPVLCCSVSFTVTKALGISALLPSFCQSYDSWIPQLLPDHCRWHGHYLITFYYWNSCVWEPFFSTDAESPAQLTNIRLCHFALQVHLVTWCFSDLFGEITLWKLY